MRQAASIQRNTRFDGSAFTLIEVMMVIGILALLIGIVFKGGGAMITRAKVRDTEAMIKTLKQAIDAYSDEVNQSRIPFAAEVFTGAPPDNVHVFQKTGTMIESCRVAFVHDGQLKQNGSPLQDRSFTDMRDSAGQLSGLDPTKLMHGDVRAMVLAMRLRSPKASEILDRIDARFKRSGGDEGLFFDSDPGGTGDEIPLDYYVDAWGTPLEYYATGTRSACTSTTYREAAANFILHKSNLYPVLVSYGPNGPDQLSKEFMDTFGDTTIVGDFWNQPVPSTTQTGLVNHELNHDNIYSVDGLKERLRTGL